MVTYAVNLERTKCVADTMYLYKDTTIFIPIIRIDTIISDTFIDRIIYKDKLIVHLHRDTIHHNIEVQVDKPMDSVKFNKSVEISVRQKVLKYDELREKEIVNKNEWIWWVLFIIIGVLSVWLIVKHIEKPKNV
jgi:hypothetical protein